MKLTSEQLDQTQECMSAEELVQKASEAGHDLTLEQAQKIIDSAEMVEVDEDNLDMVAGGDDLDKVLEGHAFPGKIVRGDVCTKCGKSTLYVITATYGELTRLKCNYCQAQYYMTYNSFQIKPYE